MIDILFLFMVAMIGAIVVFAATTSIFLIGHGIYVAYKKHVTRRRSSRLMATYR